MRKRVDKKFFMILLVPKPEKSWNNENCKENQNFQIFKFLSLDVNNSFGDDLGVFGDIFSVFSVVGPFLSGFDEIPVQQIPDFPDFPEIRPSLMSSFSELKRS